MERYVGNTRKNQVTRLVTLRHRSTMSEPWSVGAHLIPQGTPEAGAIVIALRDQSSPGARRTLPPLFALPAVRNEATRHVHKDRYGV